MGKKNQRERILDYIREHGSITTMDAFMDLGIARLASRIHDLRSDGYNIHGEMVTGKNRWGQPVRYMEYTLKG